MPVIELTLIRKKQPPVPSTCVVLALIRKGLEHLTPQTTKTFPSPPPKMAQTSHKKHFFKIYRDVGMANHEKQLKQERDDIPFTHIAIPTSFSSSQLNQHKHNKSQSIITSISTVTYTINKKTQRDPIIGNNTSV